MDKHMAALFLLIRIVPLHSDYGYRRLKSLQRPLHISDGGTWLILFGKTSLRIPLIQQMQFEVMGNKIACRDYYRGGFHFFLLEQRQKLLPIKGFARDQLR